MFLIFLEKTAKNPKRYGFYRYFSRSRYLRHFYHFFLNQDPKTRRYGKLKQNQALELNGSLSRVFLKLYKLKKTRKHNFLILKRKFFKFLFLQTGFIVTDSSYRLTIKILIFRI